MAEPSRGTDATRRKVAAPGWRGRFGCVLTLLEVVALVLVVSHFDAATPYFPAEASSRIVMHSHGSNHAKTAAAHPVIPTSTTLPTPVPSAAPVPTPTTTAPPAPAPVRAPTPTTVAPTPAVPTPADPAANIAPSPNFLADCSSSTYDDSPGCVQPTVEAIDNARAAEGIGPMVLPTNWTQLTVGQQTFVMTNLERTARGMPALSVMATDLEGAAQAGADASSDPAPPSGFPFSQWGSNWAGEMGNPLEALYYWMYDDGPGSSNIECTPSNSSGCWGHRHNILMAMACHPCVMGAGYDATGYQNTPSLTELMVDTSGDPAADFTWAQEQPYLS